MHKIFSVISISTVKWSVLKLSYRLVIKSVVSFLFKSQKMSNLNTVYLPIYRFSAYSGKELSYCNWPNCK